jgi:hypothetical protein
MSGLRRAIMSQKVCLLGLHQVVKEYFGSNRLVFSGVTYSKINQFSL